MEMVHTKTEQPVIPLTDAQFPNRPFANIQTNNMHTVQGDIAERACFISPITNMKDAISIMKPPTDHCDINDNTTEHKDPIAKLIHKIITTKHAKTQHQGQQKGETGQRDIHRSDQKQASHAVQAKPIQNSCQNQKRQLKQPFKAKQCRIQMFTYLTQTVKSSDRPKETNEIIEKRNKQFMKIVMMDNLNGLDSNNKCSIKPTGNKTKRREAVRVVKFKKTLRMLTQVGNDYQEKMQEGLRLFAVPRSNKISPRNSPQHHGSSSLNKTVTKQPVFAHQSWQSIQQWKASVQIQLNQLKSRPYPSAYQANNSQSSNSYGCQSKVKLPSSYEQTNLECSFIKRKLNLPTWMQFNRIATEFKDHALDKLSPVDNKNLSENLQHKDQNSLPSNLLLKDSHQYRSVVIFHNNIQPSQAAFNSQISSPSFQLPQITLSNREIKCQPLLSKQLNTVYRQLNKKAWKLNDRAAIKANIELKKQTKRRQVAIPTLDTTQNQQKSLKTARKSYR